jgi:hypothetical protein
MGNGSCILDKINTVAFSPERRQKKREERPSKVYIRQNDISVFSSSLLFLLLLRLTSDLHQSLINI